MTRTIKQWLRLKTAVRNKHRRGDNHWIVSPTATDDGVCLSADELEKMVDAIDKAREQVRHLLCEHTPYDCKPDEQGPLTCDTCKLRWALAEVVRD